MSDIKLLHKVLINLVLTMILSFIGMVVGFMFFPPEMAILAMIVVIVLIIFSCFIKAPISKEKKYSYKRTMPMFIVYMIALVNGIALYPAIACYISDIGGVLVMAVFGVTILLFGSLFLYSYITKKDFSFLSGMLFFSLFALVIVSIVAMFINVSLLSGIIAIFGTIIFSGYVLYDVSMMKKYCVEERDVPLVVLNLYLDFINLFLDLLRIASYFKD